MSRVLSNIRTQRQEIWSKSEAIATALEDALDRTMQTESFPDLLDDIQDPELKKHMIEIKKHAVAHKLIKKKGYYPTDDEILSAVISLDYDEGKITDHIVVEQKHVKHRTEVNLQFIKPALAQLFQDDQLRINSLEVIISFYILYFSSHKTLTIILFAGHMSEKIFSINVGL